MLCVVIKGPTLEEARQQISKALNYADLVELRLDYFSQLEESSLKQLQRAFSIPMIFTLRSQSQGGNYTQSEKNRLSDIRRLAALNPEFFDLESHIPAHFIEEIITQYPNIKIIFSYHNFNETPQDLENLYQQMLKIPAFFYKIAVTANNSLDALRLLCWTKESKKRLITISMGSYGQISRIIGPILQNPITYACLDDNQQTASGQLSAQILTERYRYPSLNSQTAIYGLIGDPVEQSLSHDTHNNLIKEFGLNAVYIKMQVKPPELAEFLQLAKELPFSGLSVTMPLKEHILPFLDSIDPHAHEIGSVNTLLFAENKITGYNTDGMGALNAIERELNVRGKKILMIGAGGAAKAIAYESYRRGALLTIINRNINKAQDIAIRLGGKAKTFDQIPECFEEGYDLLINCIPTDIPIDAKYLPPNAFVMDIKTRAVKTEFLKFAKEKGCQIIYGYQMFIEQAILQFALWFKYHINLHDSRKILQLRVIEILFKET